MPSLPSHLTAFPPALLGLSPRVRKSPYYEATRRYGAKAFTVYNHMYMPLYYESPEQDYAFLMRDVTLWDVAVERQVEIIGPDAHKLVSLMTPRNISRITAGQCKYAPLTDHEGGMINDPVLLCLAADHYWLSLADSDVLLWAKGLAQGLGLKVHLSEPDVSPLALQGPLANEVAAALFGDRVHSLHFFTFYQTDFEGMPLVIARSGWSKQGGFELYLRDGQYGEQLWERVMAAGKPWNIKPATPNAIERIESGLLSYGSDMTLANNPLELGLETYCDLQQPFDFIGKEALKRIQAQGITQKLVGLTLSSDDLLPRNEHHWPTYAHDQQIGNVTSATYSPRLNTHIALALLDISYTQPGTLLSVYTPFGSVPAQVVSLPFC